MHSETAGMTDFKDDTYLLREDESVDHIHHLLVGSRQVRPHLLDQPLLPGDPGGPVAIKCLLPRPQLDGLVGLDDGGTDSLLNDSLLPGYVRAWGRGRGKNKGGDTRAGEGQEQGGHKDKEGGREKGEVTLIKYTSLNTILQLYSSDSGVSITPLQLHLSVYS